MTKIFKEGKVDLKSVPRETVLNIAMEESAELIQAISKNLRGKGDYDNTCEEIADVLITIDWLIEKLNLKPQDIEEWYKYKVQRCNKKIKKGEFK